VVGRKKRTLTGETGRTKPRASLSVWQVLERHDEGQLHTLAPKVAHRRVGFSAAGHNQQLRLIPPPACELSSKPSLDYL
jgi:hypothetical protein